MSANDLRSRAQQYIAVRQAVGFQSRPAERLLLDFVAFLESRGHTGRVTAQLALEWACLTSAAGSRGGQARRLSVARRFLVHLRASVPSTEVPAAGLLRQPTRPKPHIYSDEQLRTLLHHALALGPAGSLRPHTYAALIGLLVSCGLRISEALRLKVGDVRLDETPTLLHVGETKFHKSRLVPLHPTAATALRIYSAQRHRLGYDSFCDRFFVSEKPGVLPAGSARRTFAELGRSAGLRPPTGRGPRLHDLRHTFAVRRLLQWYSEGFDVQARLPELSVYLGHLRPEDTYWYLSATPQLLQVAANRFEAFIDRPGGP